MFYLYTLNSARIAKAVIDLATQKHLCTKTRDEMMVRATQISTQRCSTTFFISEKGNLHDTRDGHPVTPAWAGAIAAPAVSQKFVERTF